MNTVRIRDNKPKVSFKLGSIWKRRELYYVLCSCADTSPAVYFAASLSYGNTWNGLKPTEVAAVDGLEFVSEEAKITIDVT